MHLRAALLLVSLLLVGFSRAAVAADAAVIRPKVEKFEKKLK